MFNDKEPAASNPRSHHLIPAFFSKATSTLQRKMGIKPPIQVVETAYMLEDYSIEVCITPVAPDDNGQRYQFIVTQHSPVYFSILKNHPVLRPGIFHKIERAI